MDSSIIYGPYGQAFLVLFFSLLINLLTVGNLAVARGAVPEQAHIRPCSGWRCACDLGFGTSSVSASGSYK